MRFGVFEVDLRARELRKNGLKVRLQDQPFQILEMLLARPRDIVAREELRQKLWPADTFVDFDHSLNTAINKIREALGDSAENPRFIETLPRRGYRFLLPVEGQGATGAVAQEPPSPMEGGGTETQPKLPLLGPGLTRRWRYLVAGLIALGVLILGALSVYLGIRQGKEADALAVLPFSNSNSDPATLSLCDSITESLIHSLSQVPHLRVKSFTSADRYRGRPVDLQKVGRELGVRAVLTGKVMLQPDGLDVRMELVDVQDSSHIWGGQYQGKLADMLMVQQEVSKEVSENLRLRLSGEDRNRVEAYQLYLLGRNYWNKRTVEGLNRGIQYFQQAIDRDQRQALAYAALADSYNMLGRYGAEPPSQAYPKAKEAALKALRLNERLAEAHTALAFVKHRYEWDWPGAEAEFKRAIELKPDYAPAHQWYSSYLIAMGRVQESVHEAEETRRLDPLSLVTRAHLGWIMYLGRDYGQAIDQCQKTLDLDPNFFVARRYLGLAMAQKGLRDEAVAELERAAALSGGGLLIKAELGYAYAMAGKKADARKLLEEMTDRSKHAYVSPYFIATVYSGLGEKERSVTWLEQAFQDRADELVYLKVEPRFDNLRDLPRFQDLLRRMNFRM